MKKYYSMERDGDVVTLNIYGDITSMPWFDSDVTANSIVRQIDEASDASLIEVFINSYGGEVAEGLAIYNALKRHKATVVTHCEGFACSIASVIFMAGDQRIMNDSSLLMIHNAWSFAEGNAAALRKQADDLEKITQASVEAYKTHSNLTEEEIKELMDAETWILPTEALEYGFATAIGVTESKTANQSARSKLFAIVKASQEAAAEDESEEDDEAEEETAEGENGEADDSEDAEEGTEEETDEVEEDSGEESEDEKQKESANQKWSGFFNAIMKM